MKLSLSELERICEGNSTGFERIFPLEAKETMYFRVRCMPNNPVFRVSLSHLFDGYVIAGIDTSRLDSKTKDETLVGVEQGKLVEIVTKEWRPV